MKIFFLSKWLKTINPFDQKTGKPKKNLYRNEKYEADLTTKLNWKSRSSGWLADQSNTVAITIKQRSTGIRDMGK